MRYSIQEKLNGKQRQKELNNSWFQQHQTQLTIILISLLPTIILITSTFVSLLFLQTMCLDIIGEFADQLYSDQINNSKLQNQAVLFQINSQVQKISWQINLINQFFQKEILYQVSRNEDYVPAIHNMFRTYNNQENQEVLALFKKNSIYTSVWHQVSKAYLSQLDEKELEQLYHSTHLDYLWKAIKHNSNIQGSRWLQIGAIYIGFSYDGMMYVTSNNTTYAGYKIPDDCPYVGPYRLDIRCRYYYQPTIDSISTVIFSPQINIGFGTYYFASNFCQRSIQYKNSNPDSKNDPYGVLCITLSLSAIPIYFQNFSSNSKYQMLLDPLSLTVVYSSLSTLQQSESITVNQIETNYLQDQQSSKIFLENVGKYKNYLLSSSDQVEFISLFESNQKTFEYNRNGTECFVIVNIVTFIDKVPKYETLKSIDPSKKFEKKSVYLFLDVLSKQKMQIYSEDLQNTIIYYNKIFTYVSWGLIIVILLIQIYYSINLGVFLLQPVIHLTYILRQIKFLNQKQTQKEKQQQNPEKSLKLVESQFTIITDSHTQQDQVVIDEQIDADFHGLCFSSDTQELLDSFQNLFKILRFTTQNFYKENESVSLLNLNIQIQHFQQFGNQRALGVCYNNMGVIHYNCGRYLEALQNFQKAIICAKYELDIYSQDQQENSIEDNIKRFTDQVKSTLSQRISFQGNNDIANPSNITSEKSRAKSQFNENCHQNFELEQLYWNLFNRNCNYCDSLYQYSQKFDNYLIDIFEDLVVENMSLSQLYLPPSIKRDFMNYYALSKGKLFRNQLQEADCILNKLNLLYLKNCEHKHNIGLKSILQSSVQNQNSAVDRNIEVLLENKNIQFSMNESVILMAPIVRSKENHVSSSSLNNNFFKNRIDDYIYHKRSTFQKNARQNQNNDEDENKRSFENQKDMSKKQLQKSNQFCNNSHLEKLHYQNIKPIQKLVNVTSPSSAASQESKQNFNFNKEKILSSNISQSIFNRSNTQKDYQQKLKRSKQDKIEQSGQNISDQNLKTNSKNQLKQRFNFQHLFKKKKMSFYQVRKIKKIDKLKLSIYNFSSDVYFQFCAVQQAQFQIKQHNYYNAAMILTNTLEQSKYYLPFLKNLELQILTEIFHQNELKSEDLQETYQKYNSLTNCDFNVCLISVCRSSEVKKRVYALSSDLISEILYKDNDNFGLIQYSFKDRIFNQIINFTGIKSIKSNLFLFEGILFQIFQHKQYFFSDAQYQNNGIQNIEMKESQIKYQKQQILHPNKATNQQTGIFSCQNSMAHLKQANPKNYGDHTFHDINQQALSQNKIISKSIINNHDISDDHFDDKQIIHHQNTVESSESSFDSTDSNEIDQNYNKNEIKVINYAEPNLQNYNLQNFVNKNKFNYNNQDCQKEINGLNFKETDYLSNHNFNYLQKSLLNKLNEYSKQGSNAFQIGEVLLDKVIEKKQKASLAPEQIFHLGIHNSLKQYILNSDEKLTIYLTQNKQNKHYDQKLSYTFLVYFTDQQLYFSNTFLLKELAKLLLHLQIELLVLVQNDQQNQQEFTNLHNFVENGKSVITFFQTEEKLLQYIYNYREHLKNYSTPLVVEHF